MGRVCSERDCRIFRGMIQACDCCAKYAKLGYGEKDTQNQAFQAPLR